MFEPPETIKMGRSQQTTIGALMLMRDRLYEDPQSLIVADRYVMGHALPSWQRHPAWDGEQNRRFIESIWKGVPLGSYMIVEEDWRRDGEPEPFSGALIDGQQRLRAIEAYLNNEFKVFGAIWSDVPLAYQRRFKNTVFPCRIVDFRDETQLRQLYDLLNFSGVAHQEHERAMPAGA